MDRKTAAAVIGVAPGAPRREVDCAFRARARELHPDHLPPASAEWREATTDMQRLNEARRVLLADSGAPSGARVSAGGCSSGAGCGADADMRVDVTGDGVRYSTAAWAASLTRNRPVTQPRVIRTLPEALRRARNRTMALGCGLLAASIGSLAVGAAQPVNDALPVWSPGLAVAGCASLAVAVRAQRRLIAIRRG